ncbi:MAG: F0F1 ATP synthase subunit B [Gammaproteobacteria bacterium RIFCSPHIGHO2_12_FULL_41_15]|nr:MAG: F0F1 ATP synthase subunit B [Gammaproteobacteria bacterium RIFCSPHIGHO2_12_FULL_41_15]
MDLNFTLIGQLITFIIFVWFTMKYVWPPLVKALEDRRQQIADGLAAAEKGRHALADAKVEIQAQLEEGKKQAADIIDHANKRAQKIIEESKITAREEGERLLALAKAEIQQEFNAAKEDLLQQVSALAVAGAEKIIRQSVDREASNDLVKDIIAGV